MAQQFSVKDFFRQMLGAAFPQCFEFLTCAEWRLQDELLLAECHSETIGSIGLHILRS